MSARKKPVEVVQLRKALSEARRRLREFAKERDMEMAINSKLRLTLMVLRGSLIVHADEIASQVHALRVLSEPGGET